jgi:glycosyltransferase involved in cell wall biosynthesis
VVGDYDVRAEQFVQGLTDRITCYGFVSDFSEILTRCEVALLPIVEGTGVKTKVLDAMAMGIPVVTNRLGVEGLAVEHGREVLLAESPEDLCEAIGRVATDGALSAQLSKAARRYVEKYHDPVLLRDQYQLHVTTAIEKGRERLLERTHPNLLAAVPSDHGLIKQVRQ